MTWKMSQPFHSNLSNLIDYYFSKVESPKDIVWHPYMGSIFGRNSQWAIMTNFHFHLCSGRAPYSGVATILTNKCETWAQKRGSDDRYTFSHSHGCQHFPTLQIHETQHWLHQVQRWRNDLLYEKVDLNWWPVSTVNWIRSTLCTTKYSCMVLEAQFTGLSKLLYSYLG